MNINAKAAISAAAAIISGEKETMKASIELP